MISDDKMFADTNLNAMPGSKFTELLLDHS